MSEDYTGFSACKAILKNKYGGNLWFNQTLSYLSIRYRPIHYRILDALRYVELAPINAMTFSYEFSSTVKDVGGTFSSVLDMLVRNTSKEKPREYDIRDYRKFLINEVENIDLIGVRLRTAFKGNMIFPFVDIKKPYSLQWWNAYNNLKHSEMDNISGGCLLNVLHGMASLAVLYCLMGGRYQLAEGGLFYLIGFFEPRDALEEFKFPRLRLRQKKARNI